MAFTTIPNATFALDEAIKSSTGLALRDNPISIASAEDGAPVNMSAWHPYDKVTNGDANIGLLYDSAVNGSVVAVESPTFAAGFEYRMRWWNINGNTPRVDVFDTVWTTGYFGGSTAGPGSGWCEIGFSIRHRVNQAGAVQDNSVIIASGAAAWNLTKMRIVGNGGNITTGRVWLDKRRGHDVI